MLRANGFVVEFVALEPGTKGHPLPARVLGPSRWSPKTWWSLYRCVAAGGVIVAMGGNALIPCATLGFLRRRPVVYGGIGDPAAWGAVHLAGARVGLPLRMCRRVLAIYPAAAEYLVERYGLRPDRVRVVTNGRDTHRFHPSSDEARADARRSIPLPPDGLWIGFVGALSEEKRPQALIEAMAADSSLRLVIAGDGPLRGECESLAARSAPGRIHFLGQVDDARIVYQVVDAVAMTGRTEGVPGVAIEAGLSGLPVVATDVGGVSFVVVEEETGRLVALGDELALIRALRDARVAPR